eukprot:4335390-Heterocapsa_arctica.AAC.1
MQPSPQWSRRSWVPCRRSARLERLLRGRAGIPAPPGLAFQNPHHPATTGWRLLGAPRARLPVATRAWRRS